MNLKDQRVLVTGGAGYIGAHLCKRLFELGAHPVVFDNLSRGFPSNVRWGPFFEGDIREKDEVLEALNASQANAVIHLAGLANARESVERAELYKSVNHLGTVNLLQAIEEIGGLPFIFSSSCSVYGTADQAVSESSSLKPESPYGVSKLKAENAVREWSERTGCKSVALRYFNVAGADKEVPDIRDHYEDVRIIPKFLKEALFEAQPVLKIYGDNFNTEDGTCVRDYIHVLDIVEAHISALVNLTSLNDLYSVFNVSSELGISNMMIAQAVKKACGDGVEIQLCPRQAGDPAKAVGNATKVKRELGWVPKYPELQFMIESLMVKYKASQFEGVS